jgi:hypothetical protein
MIIPANWNLPEPIRSRLSPTTYGRQRAIIEDGHLLLVLHKPPGPDDSGREGVLFWRNPAGEWHMSRGAVGGVKRHVQDYVQLEAKLSEQYDVCTSTETLFELMEAVNPAARAARNLHLALQTAREGVPEDPFLIEVRDLAYEAERNLELLLEDVRNAIQYRTLREAEKQAHLTSETVRANHRLNILVALFLPLTAIGGMFGMNLPSGLEHQHTSLFWIVLTLGIALGLVIVAWVLGKRRG